MRHLAAALLSAVLAGPAPACPAGADLAGNGILVRFADGAVTRFQRTEAGTVLETTTGGGEERAFWFESEGGIRLVADGPMEGETRQTDQTTTYRYDSSVPQVRPGLRLEYRLSVVRPDGSVLPGIERLNAGAEGSLAIGECSYRSIPIHGALQIEGEEGGAYFLQHIPDLGISVTVAYGPMGQPYDVNKTPVAITVATP